MTNILNVMMEFKGNCDITIKGTSMEPVLHDGESYKLKKQEEYAIGDILVYEYKNEGLLAHRLLKIEQNRYFCKGDNSFRLEDIPKDQIIGRIETVDPNNTPEFIEASYKISKLFRKCRYSHEEIIKQDEYIEYRRKYLEK